AQGPVPGGLVPRGGEGAHVLGPPQSLQRWHHVVPAELVLRGKLQRVGHRVEALDGGGEGGGVRVAVAVDHQVAAGGHVQHAEHTPPGEVGVELLLQVDLLRHQRRPWSLHMRRAYPPHAAGALVVVKPGFYNHKGTREDRGQRRGPGAAARTGGSGGSGQSRGSTGSDSSASTPNTHWCTRHSGSPAMNRRSASSPSAHSRAARERLCPVFRSRTRLRGSGPEYAGPDPIGRECRPRTFSPG